MFQLSIIVPEFEDGYYDDGPLKHATSNKTLG